MENVQVALYGIKFMMFLWDSALGTSSRCESNVILGLWHQLSCHWLLEILYCRGKVLNMVHFYFTLSFRAHQLQIWISISHNTTFGWFSRALRFHGIGSWFMCKTIYIYGANACCMRWLAQTCLNFGIFVFCQ